MKQKNLFTKSCFSVLFFLLTLCLLTGCSKKNKDSNVSLNRALAIAVNNGNWKKVLSYSKDAVQANPKNEYAMVLYALALEQNNQPDDAVKQLSRAIELNPKDFLAQLSLGKILYKQGHYEQAYNKLTNAHDLNSDDIDAMILFTQCSMKLQAQNTDQLLQKLFAIESINNKPEIHNEAAIYYLNIGDLNKAAQEFAKAYKLAPNNPSIILNLAVFCDNNLKQSKKARYFYRKYLSVANNNTTTRNQIIVRLKELKYK